MAGVNVKRRPHANHHLAGKPAQIRRHKLFLLGRTESDPNDVRVRGFHQVFDRKLLCRLQRMKRGRKRSYNLKAWELLMQAIRELVCDARIAAIIGTGGQAKTQLEAIATVRKLDSVNVFGRDPRKREAFCKEMSARVGIPVRAAASASEAVRGAHVVCTATTAVQPVVNGADLTSGVHINAIGANHAHKRELDDEAVASADVIVVDSIEQSRQEAGDLIIAFHGDESCWTGVKRLPDVVAGKTSGRTSDTEVTLFKSNGIASWDLAVAIKVYKAAREAGLGRELPLWSESALD